MLQIPDKRYSDYIDSRIRDIEIACQRSRWTYVALITVSWLILAMAYNSTFSFARGIANHAKLLSDCKDLIDPENKVPEKIPSGYERCLEIRNVIMEQRAKLKKEELVAGRKQLTADREAVNTQATQAIAEYERGTVDPLKPSATGPNGKINDPGDGSMLGAGPVDPTVWMRNNFLKDWTGSLFFEFPVVGGRFSAVDAGAIGGCCPNAYHNLGIFFSPQGEPPNLLSGARCQRVALARSSVGLFEDSACRDANLCQRLA